MPKFGRPSVRPCREVHQMSAEVRVGDLCRGLQRLDSFMDSVRADNDLALGVVSACSLLFEKNEWSAEVDNVVSL